MDLGFICRATWMNQIAVTAKSSIYLNTMPATKESHKSSSFELCHLCLLILAISLSLIIHLSYYWSQQSFRIQQIFYFFPGSISVYSVIITLRLQTLSVRDVDFFGLTILLSVDEQGSDSWRLFCF